MPPSTMRNGNDGWDARIDATCAMRATCLIRQVGSAANAHAASRSSSYMWPAHLFFVSPSSLLSRWCGHYRVRARARLLEHRVIELLTASARLDGEDIHHVDQSALGA